MKQKKNRINACYFNYIIFNIMLIILPWNFSHAKNDIVYAKYFNLQQDKTQQCLTVINTEPDFPYYYPITNNNVNNYFKSKHTTLDICDNRNDNQQWLFNHDTKRIHSKKYGNILCLTLKKKSITMEICRAGNLAQLWYFNKKTQLNSRFEFKNPQSYITVMQNTKNNSNPLIFQFNGADIGDTGCYLNPFLGKLECNSVPIIDSNPNLENLVTKFLLKSNGLCLAIENTDEDSEVSPVCTVEGVVDEQICSSSSVVSMQECIDKDNSQSWSFNFSEKKIIYLPDEKNLCLTKGEHNLGILPCNDSQTKWQFLPNKNLTYQIDGDENLHPIYSTDNERRDEPTPLQFEIVGSYDYYPSCYESPVTGKGICGSLYQPDTEWALSTEWSWVSNKITEDMFLTDRNNPICLQVDTCYSDSGNDMQYDCYGNSPISMTTCKNTNNQKWKHDLIQKRLFNKMAGEQFCLSWKSEQLTLEHCLPPGLDSTQKWYFARGKIHNSLDRRLLRFYGFGLRDPYPYLKGLRQTNPEYFNYKKNFSSILKIEYKSIFQSEYGKSCGFHPVTGDKGPPCIKSYYP